MNSGSGSYKEIIMIKRRSTRRGFTLPEVLVTVAIVSILAAVVVPAVTQQISKGDQGQFTGTVQGIQTGMTSYVADVRRFPLFLSDLATKPAAGDSLLPKGVLTAQEVNRWNGPYLQASVDSAVAVGLGFGLNLQDHLAFNSTTNFVYTRLTPATSTADSALVVHLDSLLDNANGNTKGFLRWVPKTLGGLDSAWINLVTAR